MHAFILVVVTGVASTDIGVLGARGRAQPLLNYHVLGDWCDGPWHVVDDVEGRRRGRELRRQTAP